MLWAAYGWVGMWVEERKGGLNEVLGFMGGWVGGTYRGGVVGIFPGEDIG